MPIHPRSPIRAKTQECFREIDYRVMGKAFSIHNEFGPHLSEMIYKTELTLRLRELGLTVTREAPIDLTFEDYRRSVFVDLLVEDGVVYEIKTASAISPAHRSQTLNYLFVTGTSHGKLINFRGNSVQGEYVSTTLDLTSRQTFEVCSQQFDAVDALAVRWRDLLIAVVRDWGFGLNLNWYREAIAALLDKVAPGPTDIQLTWKGRPIGSHAVQLLTTEVMWMITAVDDRLLMKAQLSRFLSLTDLRFIHWANIRKHCASFHTICR